MASDRGPGADDPQLKRLREAKARFGEELLRVPGVHGIGIGFKRTGGKRTKQLALVVHVHRKLPKEELRPAELLPDRLEFRSREDGDAVSAPIDVREAIPPVPEVRCQTCDVNFAARVRPVPGGFSFGLASQAGGTLGGWVWDDTNDQIAMISNHHVLGGTANAQVIQPSIGDGGSSPADNFGRVVRAGTLDVSIARPTDADDIDLSIPCSTEAVFEIAYPYVGMEVEKAGQTTGLTCGLVDLIDYDSGHYGSRSDIWIDGDGSDFSMAGDSGSLYVERSHPDGRSWKRVVGIHWGGSGDDGIGHPMGAVMADVNAITVCSGLFRALIEAINGRDGEREAEEATGGRGGWPRRSNAKIGLARDLEQRLLGGVASDVSDLIHTHRVPIARVLLTGDGRRAALALLAPVLAGAVTTDDVLDHRIDETDLANARRLLKVARRIQPDVKAVAEFAEPLMNAALGRTIGELLEPDEDSTKPRME